MSKYNHKAKTLTSSMGISDERKDAIGKIMMDFMNGEQAKGKITFTKSEAFEAILPSLESLEEAAFIGYVFGRNDGNNGDDSKGAWDDDE